MTENSKESMTEAPVSSNPKDRKDETVLDREAGFISENKQNNSEDMSKEMQSVNDAETQIPQQESTNAVTSEIKNNQISNENSYSTAVALHDPVNINALTRTLNSLEYSPITCDGIPRYQLTGSDGTVFYFNFESGDYGWVWRNTKRSDGSMYQEEAVLTKFAAGMINEFRNVYGLEECEF